MPNPNWPRPETHSIPPRTKPYEMVDALALGLGEAQSQVFKAQAEIERLRRELEGVRAENHVLRERVIEHGLEISFAKMEEANDLYFGTANERFVPTEQVARRLIPASLFAPGLVVITPPQRPGEPEVIYTNRLQANGFAALIGPELEH